jgi:acyl-CoA synthetase (NDP forming)
MQSRIRSDLDPLFYPRSVAVIGASGSKGKVGRMWMDRFIEAGLETLYPVNLRETEILGIKAYPSLSDIPGPVDQALILLPPNAVPSAVEECIAKGVKGITINSATLGLEGEGRHIAEQELVQTARARGSRILGPNCNGIYCPSSKLPYPLGPSMKKGSIGIVSQSGSFADLLTFVATSNNIFFSKSVSCGNELDLNAIDFLEYLSEDQDTTTVLAYLEGVKDGCRFQRVALEISKKKPLILWKTGKTEMGAKAAATHTGALAGSREVWEGIIKGAGVISIKSFEEALDCLYTFNSQPLPKGNRVVIVAGTGGPAVGTVDTCLDLGLEVPPLSPDTQERLKRIIPRYGTSTANPVDLTIAVLVNPSMFGEVLRILIQDDDVDMLIIIGANADEAFFRGIIEQKKDLNKPIAVASINPLERLAKEYKAMLGNGIPIFPDPARAANALSKLATYADFRRKMGSGE